MRNRSRQSCFDCAEAPQSDSGVPRSTRVTVLEYLWLAALPEARRDSLRWAQVLAPCVLPASR